LLTLHGAGNMGNLRPGATLRYESDSESIYAVDVETSERTLVGYNYYSVAMDNDDMLWHNIRQAALTDKNLQEALDRVKVLYYLTHNKDTVVQHHPV
jgi:hypothetical protein